jgi:hypothetical protein
MWSDDTIDTVTGLLAQGLGAAEVSRRTDVPFATILNWERGRLPEHYRLHRAGVKFCAKCGAVAHDFPTLSSWDYSYILGVYLGDGWITKHTKGTWALRVAQDMKYPGLIEECCAAIQAIRGLWPHVMADPDGTLCVKIASYWKQWPCLIPQHGPGRKHKRKIELTEWQWDLVEAAPGKFLRGLIHSDGWRGTNRVCVKGKHYEYPRYQFSNRSDDIRKLFTDVCDMLEIAWRPWTRWHISVAQRDAVARLDEHVGLKY